MSTSIMSTPILCTPILSTPLVSIYSEYSNTDHTIPVPRRLELGQSAYQGEDITLQMPPGYSVEDFK